jgi:hypothetical protein
MEKHVHGFDAFRLNFIVDYPFCCVFVGSDLGSWLLMAHLCEYLA